MPLVATIRLLALAALLAATAAYAGGLKSDSASLR